MTDITTGYAILLAFTFVVYALVVHRVTRFIWLDDLLDEPRAWLKMRILTIPTPPGELPHEYEPPARQVFWRKKLHQLLNCGWCVSIWVAGPVVIAHQVFLADGYPIPYPLFWWPALSSAAVIGLELTDGVKKIEHTEIKRG